MEEQTKRDLIISGKGSASGGTYNLVRINGYGVLTGDFECTDMKIHGSGNISGNLKAKFTQIAGKGKITGNVISELIHIQGHGDIGGNVNTKEIRFQGQGKVRGDLTAEVVRIEGGAAIVGDCSAEQFGARGNFTIGGLLNAGNIDIKLYGGSHAKEIGGEKIIIKRQKTFHLKKLLLSIFQINVGLVTEVIEGDEIYLEQTKAQIVRGKNVTIGAGCDIEHVEYTDNIEVSKAAKVNTQKKI